MQLHVEDIILYNSGPRRDSQHVQIPSEILWFGFHPSFCWFFSCNTGNDIILLISSEVKMD